MFSLRFANSIRPNFPVYEKSHSDLNSVALEILRVSELVQIDAHSPQVEDLHGKPVAKVPTATRRLETRPRTKGARQAGTAAVESIAGHDVFQVTEIDGRVVASEWMRSA